MATSRTDGWNDRPESESASNRYNNAQREYAVDRRHNNREHHVGVGRVEHYLSGRSSIFQRNESRDGRVDRSQLCAVFSREDVDNGWGHVFLLALLRAREEGQVDTEIDHSRVFLSVGVALPSAFKRAALNSASPPNDIVID